MIYDRTRKRRVTLDAKAIGKRIAKARKSRRWKQKHLAAAVGVQENTVANWEGGHRVPPHDTLVSLAIHLRRSIDWILCGVPRRGALHRMVLLKDGGGGASRSYRVRPPFPVRFGRGLHPNPRPGGRRVNKVGDSFAVKRRSGL